MEEGEVAIIQIQDTTVKISEPEGESEAPPEAQRLRRTTLESKRTGFTSIALFFPQAGRALH